jgi:hypothetical protein
MSETRPGFRAQLGITRSWICGRRTIRPRGRDFDAEELTGSVVCHLLFLFYSVIRRRVSCRLTWDRSCRSTVLCSARQAMQCSVTGWQALFYPRARSALVSLSEGLAYTCRTRFIIVYRGKTPLTSLLSLFLFTPSRLRPCRVPFNTHLKKPSL